MQVKMLMCYLIYPTCRLFLWLSLQVQTLPPNQNTANNQQQHFLSFRAPSSQSSFAIHLQDKKVKKEVIVAVSFFYSLLWSLTSAFGAPTKSAELVINPIPTQLDQGAGHNFCLLQHCAIPTTYTAFFFFLQIHSDCQNNISFERFFPPRLYFP